ncbi:hypothetical protein EMIHUDRAFT_201741 [Emiliania huxleyi CCMP1516]|uniref:Cupin type-2 domain-containing protein n=2 Tax=Emiliania huxleyi TaxID=2903 RepID=A0A0D3KII4_EMIH1|nr:hypothetical protein EMIHUDRAFT_201741 [Emiliania huxleyi CCMP1516]EOD35569.1 hypothetical protein EMIHUDRAFT_201741 [Emiliania huxleyi CCMP1516]|eukprot:XP_005787998.1 hypothetical protein EMIHUDRAFT_201741 [Emiliania huxleyi CCMP1516]
MAGAKAKSTAKADAQRKAGERTPVHMHPDPQFSCVRQGRVLDQIEGHEDKVYEPGECYLMPPNTKARLLGRSSPIQGSTPTPPSPLDRRWLPSA